MTRISVDQLLTILNRGQESGVTYLMDVRAEKENHAGHIHGSLHVPGRQAVQRADDFIAVRRGKIIFISNESARAVMAAYWYRQMGFRNVSVLQGGLHAWAESGKRLVAGASRSEPLGFEIASSMARLIHDGMLHRRFHRSSI